MGEFSDYSRKIGDNKMIKRMPFFIFAFTGFIFYLWAELNIPAIRSVNIALEGFSSEIKIVHISDAHGRGIVPFGRLSRAIKAFSPDVIVLTGDMIDESTVDFTPILKTAEHFSQIAPTLFVLGDNERANPYDNQFIQSAREVGASVLINSATTINGVSICGVDDVSFAFDNVRRALSVNDRCDILLSHSPAINGDIRELDIPLVLAGHTHGGQIRLPVVGALFLPDSQTPPHLVKGLAKDGDTQFHISAGLGTSIVPIRFMNRAEISLITVYPSVKKTP